MLADGHLADASTEVRGLRFVIGDHKLKCDAIVTDLAWYDLILGGTWLVRHNPVSIDLLARSCPFMHEGHLVSVRALDNILRNAVLNATQVARCLRKGGFAYLAFLRPAESPSPAMDLPADAPEECRALLKEFADVFPEKLPMGLPPDKGDAHRIPLVEGAQPPRRPIYQLSPAKLKELETQLKDYIDAEFRRTDATEAAELDWTDIDWSANREIMNELLLQVNDPKQLDAGEESLGLTAMHLPVLVR